MPEQIYADKTRVPVKLWVSDGEKQCVPFEEEALAQLERVANLPFVFRSVVAMPDLHVGTGATVGSVVPTVGAIIPAAVGVDLGCGMMAVRTPFSASDLPESLSTLRSAIERDVPHGRTANGGPADHGAFQEIPDRVGTAWQELADGYERIVAKYPALGRNRHPTHHLGTLGTGNHFIEVCLDEKQRVWAMLHSGSRGAGNRIGSFFIEQAKQDMRRWFINLPDIDLAYLPEGSETFADYVGAVAWAQRYAFANRQVMMAEVLRQVFRAVGREGQEALYSTEELVNCHHNYISNERHFGKNVWVTRKGAVDASEGTYGIIPGSMGTRSFIVRGKGNREAFNSCSHGAGRRMSRTQARKQFTLMDHVKATEGVECRKDADVLDETPAAYKDIEAVMTAQADLVDIIHTLKQVLCVKG